MPRFGSSLCLVSFRSLWNRKKDVRLARCQEVEEACELADRRKERSLCWEVFSGRERERSPWRLEMDF